MAEMQLLRLRYKLTVSELFMVVFIKYISWKKVKRNLCRVHKTSCHDLVNITAVEYFMCVWGGGGVVRTIFNGFHSSCQAEPGMHTCDHRIL